MVEHGFCLSPAVGVATDRWPGAWSYPDEQSMKALGSAVIHLWAAPLDLSAVALERFRQILSPDELERAGRFRLEVHRQRYVAAHGWLRRILSDYASVPAPELIFEHGQQGKPALKGLSEVQFNMAHSEDLALIGVGHRSQLGVDLEFIRPLPDAAQLVSRFFSSRESAAFQLVPEAQKACAFFNLWTRKEAWLKATGEGITNLLGSVEVSFLPGEPARLLALPGGYGRQANWSLHDLAVRPGFAAALAVAAGRAVPELHWADPSMGAGL